MGGRAARRRPGATALAELVDGDEVDVAVDVDARTAGSTTLGPDGRDALDDRRRAGDRDASPASTDGVAELEPGRRRAVVDHDRRPSCSIETVELDVTSAAGRSTTVIRRRSRSTSTGTDADRCPGWIAARGRPCLEVRRSAGATSGGAK